MLNSDPVAAMRARPAYVVSVYLGRLALIALAVNVHEMAGYTRHSPFTKTHLIALAAFILLLFFSYVYGESARPVEEVDGPRRPRAVLEQRLSLARFVDFFVLWWPRRLPGGHPPKAEQAAANVADAARRPLRKRLGGGRR
ncbi:hypothetical protein ACFQO7_11960 [Catellatospora aurea]|uniref:Uncharacterized protein n=1 Tax=Catellatospora aurea TaxID=1337874 RepID=A0ABW2GU75_9ACTN